MAKTKIVDKEEQEFRKKNQWHSFAASAWGALGAASFFAALGTLASGMISVAAGVPTTVAGGMITPSMFVLGGPLPYAVMGGLLALGAAATYMSQSEATELRVLQDEHMAKQQAQCMGVAQGKGLNQEQAQAVCGADKEFSQNQRADGKQWQQVVTAQAQEAVARVH